MIPSIDHLVVDVVLFRMCNFLIFRHLLLCSCYYCSLEINVTIPVRLGQLDRFHSVLSLRTLFRSDCVQHPKIRMCIRSRIRS